MASLAGSAVEPITLKNGFREKVHYVQLVRFNPSYQETTVCLESRITLSFPW